jgi:hypothetical protein
LEDRRVTDRVPTDDEAKKFGQWYGSGASPSGAGGGNAGSGQGAGDTFGNLINSTAATFKGIEKGAAQLGAPPGGRSLQDADPEGPVATWAKTEDTRYPIAEKAGRYAAEYGPLAMLPDVGAPGAFAKAVPELPRLARVAGKGAEGLWKGYLGGSSQGNPKAGAATGGATGTAAAVLKQFPQLAWPAGFLALEAARSGGNLPFGAWHLAHPLAALAAAAMGFAPGVSGAIGADIAGPAQKDAGNANQQ